MEESNKEYINKLDIIVHGLKRTGYHAIVNWIYRQSPSPKYFFNADHVQSDPYLMNKNGHSKLPKFDKNREALRKEKKQLILRSYEDMRIKQVYFLLDKARTQQFLGNSEKIYSLLIVRDPFNHFASRLRGSRCGRRWAWGEESIANIKLYREKWKDFAKEYLGIKKETAYPLIKINFNEWTVSEQYRKEIIDNLGFKWTDKGFEEVSDAGFGSSFDDMKSQGNASSMKVLERWRGLVDDEYYKSIFDDEIIDLSKKIWGSDFNEPISLIKK